MSGKKFGLDEKYKALGVGPRTVSINPMQDDLKKSVGMGTTSAFLTRRAILGAGSKNASSLLEKAGKSSVKEKFKKANIMGATGYAGYEIGKNDGLNKLEKTTKEFIEKSKTMGKKYGGSMKVTKANLGLLMSNKKIAGAGLLGLGMLASKKGMFNKGGESKIKKVKSRKKKA
jgi:hypothetical protein